MPGPAPKPPGTRARRNASPSMTILPAKGRQGKAPAWPLVDDIVMQVKKDMAENKAADLRGQLGETDSIKTVKRIERELGQAEQTVFVLERQIDAQRKLETEMWTELWSTPQAQIWEDLAWAREVAQYVRWKVRGELGDIEAAKEARMWSDRLGLNPLAMLRLRWEIERTEAAAEEGARRRSAPKPTSRKTDKPEDPRKGLYAVG
jgi:hypothetical protein